MPYDPLRSRLRRFMRIGLVGATLFSLFLVPSFLINGNRPIPKVGLTPLQNLAVYYLGGILGSILVAILYPIQRWFLGAFALGTVAMAPLYLGFALLVMRDIPRAAMWSIGIVLAYLVGGGVGTQIWSEHGGANKNTVVVLWIVAAACQIPGWYMGMRWAGQTLATIGLGLVFMPLYPAMLATVARKKPPEPAAA